MEQNRRNFYRILRVQPDASLDVIKSNYRTLLQKLRFHPDLGGDEWNASLINQAYNTLRNRRKRSEYDQLLLKEYSIKQLSSGHIKRPALEMEANKSGMDISGNTNHRNYYRILHVQNDSPIAIIQASFSILIGESQTDEQKNLVREAFDILSDKNKKEIYDRYLKTHEHPEAVKLLKQYLSEQSRPEKKNIKRPAGFKKKNFVFNASTNRSAYKPLITQYCSFCKTPHNKNFYPTRTQLCMECSSPLFPPTNNFLNQARRELTRFKANEPVTIYYDWPGMHEKTVATDISPTGICIHSHVPVDKGLIIKIDSNEFKAVGEITYSRKQDTFYHTGVRFLTIKFNKQKGQFFSVLT